MWTPTWVVLAVLRVTVSSRVKLVAPCVSADQVTPTNFIPKGDELVRLQANLNTMEDFGDFNAKAFAAVGPVQTAGAIEKPVNVNHIQEMLWETGEGLFLEALMVDFPVLGVVCTVFFSMLGEEEGDPLAEMEKKILEEVTSLITKSKYNERKREMVSAMEDIHRLLKECCGADYANPPREKLWTIRGLLVSQESKTFLMECKKYPDEKECKEWETSGGGAAALLYSIMYAQLVIQLDSTLLALAVPMEVEQKLGILRDDITYLHRVLQHHADSYVPYRLSLIRSQEISSTVKDHHPGNHRSPWYFSMDNGFDEVLNAPFAHLVPKGRGCIVDAYRYTVCTPGLFEEDRNCLYSELQSSIAPCAEAYKAQIEAQFDKAFGVAIRAIKDGLRITNCVRTRGYSCVKCEEHYEVHRDICVYNKNGGCQSWSSIFVCTGCRTGFRNFNGKCHCSVGHMAVKGKCVKLQAFGRCKKWNDVAKCLACKEGWIMERRHADVCRKPYSVVDPGWSANNCKKVKKGSQDICTRCHAGDKLRSGRCI